MQNHSHFLSYLATCSKRQRPLLMRSATNSEIRSLSDLVFTLAANKNIRVSPVLRTALSKHKSRILKVITTPSIKARRETLQHGGFLQALLLPVIATLAAEAGSSLVSSLLK